MDHTVFVIDSDPDVLRATRSLLESNGLTVETHRTGAEFLDYYAPDTPSCLVLDIHIGDMNGLVLQERLVATGRCPPFIYVTGNADVPTCVHAMKLGAFDFLERPADARKLAGLVHKAIAEDVKRCELERRRREIQDRLDRLTRRERQVMSRMVKGQPTKAIATELGIAQKTALRHRARVLLKLEVKTNAELVRHFLDGPFE